MAAAAAAAVSAADAAVELAAAGGVSDAPWSDEALNVLPFYHGELSRHVAESLLLSNGRDGAYLLRRCENNNSTVSSDAFVVSVRSQNAVSHFQVTREAEHLGYIFGRRRFMTLAAFQQHFANVPALSGEAGIVTPLSTPYQRDYVDADNSYDEVVIITREEAGKKVKSKSSRLSRNLEQDARQLTPWLGSREGFLFKRGQHVHSIRERWFVMCRMELAYYKSRDNKQSPIRVLNLFDCQAATAVEKEKRPFCFTLAFPKRTFYLFAPSSIERETWLNLIRWKLDQRDKAIEAGQALQSVPATWERSKTADVDSSEEGEDDEPTLAELPPLASAATT